MDKWKKDGIKSGKKDLNSISKFVTSLRTGRYFKESKFRTTSIRKLKKIPIFKLERVNGVISKKHKFVNLSEWKSHHNLNKTNRVVGFTPDFVGFQPSKLITKKNFFVNYFTAYNNGFSQTYSEEFLDEMGKSISQTRLVYSGGYDTCHQHLAESFKDNGPNPLNSLEYFKLIERCKIYDWFSCPVVSFYDKRELAFNIRVNEKSNPGHYMSRLISPLKADTTQISRTVAQKLYSFLKEGTLKNTYLWTLGKREKDIKQEGPDEEVSTRVVLFCEDPMTTLLMWFSQKLMVSFRSVKTNKFDISGEYDIKKAQKVYSKGKNFDWSLEADWKFFDSSQDTSYIETAMILLLSGLPNDIFHDRIRYLITSSIVTKYVVVPPGIVVELNRANASGHPFTTLLNCTVNTIYWSLIAQKIYGDEFRHFIDFSVYGDDALVYFKEHRNLQNIDQYVAELGLKSEPLYPALVPVFSNCKEGDKPDFLKRRLTNNGVEWNLKKMFDKLFYQSKGRTLGDQLLLIKSYLITSCYNLDLHNFAKNFYAYAKAQPEFADVSSNIIFEFEDQIMVDANYIEISDQYSYAFDRVRKDPYFSTIDPIYGWGISKFKPETVFNKMINFRKPNLDQTYLAYYLGFDKKYLEEDSLICKVGGKQEAFRCFDAMWVTELDNYLKSIDSGLKSYFNRRNLVYESRKNIS
jgi:hypothetical protein